MSTSTIFTGKFGFAIAKLVILSKTVEASLLLLDDALSLGHVSHDVTLPCEVISLAEYAGSLLILSVE